MNSIFRTVEISDSRLEVDHLRFMTVKSPSLRGRADLTLWVPPGVDSPAGVVVLLHGVYGSHWAWAFRGGAHRTAARMIAAGQIPPFVLAMPSDGLRGDGSCYVRHGDGVDFGKWIAEEVPEAARLAAPGLKSEAPVYIAGFSMGGFGALRLGASHPYQFQAISAHSSITHLSQLHGFLDESLAGWGISDGEESALEAILKAREDLPPLRFDCGVNDPLVTSNRDLHQALLSHHVPHNYEEFAGGHDWSYWEEHLADSLRFFAQVQGE